MFDVAEGQEDSRRIHQLSVFLPNRLGQLLNMTRALDAEGIRVLAISIIDAADHAVVRLVVDKPTLAVNQLTLEGYHAYSHELLGIEVPEGVGMEGVLRALLGAELNVHYVYSISSTRAGKTALAMYVEDLDRAEEALTDQGFSLLGQADLREGDDE